MLPGRKLPKTHFRLMGLTSVSEIHNPNNVFYHLQMYRALQDKLTVYTAKLGEISNQVGHNNQEQYFIT